MWLLVDDKRDLFADVIARNAKSAKECLKAIGFEVLMIDHDLGDKEEDGYKIIKWAFENNCLPPKIQIVSSNPVGRDNISAFLEHMAGFRKVNPVCFVRVETV